MCEYPLGPDTEGESVDALVARDERVRLLAHEMNEAVACTHLERLVRVVVALPREARAAEDEKDLLITLRVKRRRPLTGVDANPIRSDAQRSSRAREVGPVAADRTGFAVSALEVVPVDDVLGHAPNLRDGRHPRIVSSAAALERLRGELGAVALGLEPGLAFAKELAHLGEQLLRACALPLQGLDALEPVHHRTCLVHGPNVAGNHRRDRANSATSYDATAVRNAAGRARTPSSAVSASRNCSDRKGSFANSESSHRSRASERSGSSSALEIRSSRSRASFPRKESSRDGSPGGCVAAIGSTGRIPNGRQSSRSNRTGPAATGAAVASRRAVTASASSPAASGGSVSRRSSTRSSSSTQRRSGSVPKPAGSRPVASGQSFASSPVAATRTRSPLPSSTRPPPRVSPTSGATATYEWPRPNIP